MKSRANGLQLLPAPGCRSSHHLGPIFREFYGDNIPNPLSKFGYFLLSFADYR
jgi:hypothetical protein